MSEATTQNRPLALTAWVAGGFCLLVCATMVWWHFAAATNDPWKSPQLLALKQRLAAEPNNERLQQDIRRLDAEFRQRFRRRLSLDRSGAWLLLGGTLALIAAARRALELNRARRLELSPPNAQADLQAIRLAAHSRWAVTAAGGAIFAALLLIALVGRKSSPPLSSSAVAAPSAAPGGASLAAGAAGAPTLAEFQANFPRFRGWDGSGFSLESNAPLAWEGQSGGRIAWKTPVLAPGHNSPVVWSNRLFISGATASRREVFAYDTADGRLVWQRAVENVPGSLPGPELSEDTGYAASTTATDGRMVFAIFANGDLAAVTLDGVLAWSKFVGPLKNPYGHGTSLAIWPGELLVQLDQGENTPANSKLLALEPRTGRVLWERSRPVTASWATPILIQTAGKTQLIALGLPWVISYSCQDGAELWRAELLEGELVPSPVSAGGLLIAASPSSRLLALRTDGAGDVTKSAVAWTNQDSVPDIPSPVSNGELVFAALSVGDLACFDAKSGAKIWAQDLEMQIEASPAIVGGRLFVLGLNGTAIVAEAGRKFKEIARSQLPDKFVASPAFANGRTFLRGETNLYCIAPAAMAAARAP